MNDNKLLLRLFVKKGFRNAFILVETCAELQIKVKIMKKKFAVVLLAILTVSAFSFLVDAYAMPFMNEKMIPRSIGSTSIHQNYVRMDGVVNAWGSNTVIGAIQAQSRTTIVNSTNTIQGYSCTAIWTTNTTRPISAVRARENFTYSFYVARLVDGNYSALDYNGNSFFMNGTWNVWNITETFTIITDSSGNITSINRNQNLVPLATQAYGELTVPSGWSTFTLSISGIDPLSGKVVFYTFGSRGFNPFMLGTGSSTTVTPADLNSIAKAYGSMPGWGNYDLRMDYALHYRIDICDLSTAAANLNQ
jgi:hypothetical protein